MKNIELLIFSLEYIETHLQDDIKTTDIANACFCSKSTLEKLFQCVNSISVREYIIRRRMMHAARELTLFCDVSILSLAVKYGYSSHEAFARAFKNIWNCNPSEFRNKKRFSELYPQLRGPISEGEEYIMQRKNVDISQLYDLFIERKDCYFVCTDINGLIPINNISMKAGDLAILEALNRLDRAAGEEDIAFRIGGDEFCILTGSTSEEYAQKIADEIKSHNGETFEFEGQKIPLTLYAFVAKCGKSNLKYNELFTELHLAIKKGKENL